MADRIRTYPGTASLPPIKVTKATRNEIASRFCSASRLIWTTSCPMMCAMRSGATSGCARIVRFFSIRSVTRCDSASTGRLRPSPPRIARISAARSYETRHRHNGPAQYRSPRLPYFLLLDLFPRKTAACYSGFFIVTGGSFA